MIVQTALEIGEKIRYIQFDMAPIQRPSPQKSPTGGAKKQILLVAPAPDLLGHLASLDRTRWEVEAREAWSGGEEPFLTLVDGLNLRPEEVERRAAGSLTVYLSGPGFCAGDFVGGLGWLALSREQFLRSDIHFSLAVLSEIRPMVTYIKDLEGKFQPYARQAQLGAALQGFVHNINNQMASILGLLEILRLENSHLRDIPLLYERCLRLHADFSNLLRVSRRDRQQEVTSFDMNALIQEELRLIVATDPLLRGRAVCETHLDAELPPCYGIYSDFSHSFVNLVRNALDAMTAVDSPRLIVRTGQNAESIWLEVEDHGVGIPEHIVSEVFKPYFSVRERAEGQDVSGLGLGLSTSRELLEKYGVTWKVESQVGVGTRFVLNFPKEKVCRPPDT